MHLLTKGNYSNLCVKWSNCAIIFCDSFFIDFKDNHDVIVKVCYLYVASKVDVLSLLNIANYYIHNVLFFNYEIHCPWNRNSCFLIHFGLCDKNSV